jgi:hypothetical protein
MNILSKLLGGPSPFERLQRHLDEVMKCVDMMEPILEASLKGDGAEVKRLAQEIFLQEHEADKVKIELRDSLPRSVYMPVNRSDMLDFLKRQDGLADKAEDLAMVLAIRPLRLPEGDDGDNVATQLREMAGFAIESAHKIAEIVRRFEDLREAGFKGPIAQEIRERCDEVNLLEHKADKRQFKLLSVLLSEENNAQDFIDIYIQLQVISAFGKLANHAESMGDTLRLMVAE